MLGWLGNLFIVIGLWGIGNKQRNAFIFSVIGEALYIARSFMLGDWALLVVCCVFLLMAIRGFIMWGKTSVSSGA